MSNQPISWEVMQRVVVDTLAVDIEDVTPAANFFADLGGESIDLLDLSFRCQNAFGFSPQFNQLSASGWELDANGSLTEASRDQLVAQYPFLADELPTGEFRWQQLFTIGVIHEFVRRSQPSSTGASMAPEAEQGANAVARA